MWEGTPVAAGIGLAGEMREANVKLNVISFSAANSACEKGGSWE